jgi:quercetin dioxygenase-like cupin family protein
MPFVDTTRLEIVEKRPGWHGRFFHSPSLTFANWRFEADASIHRHDHPQEEVWQILEGELEVTIDGVATVAGPGMAAIIPANTPHSVVARTNGLAMVVDYPLRPEMVSADR